MTNYKKSINQLKEVLHLFEANENLRSINTIFSFHGELYNDAEKNLLWILNISVNDTKVDLTVMNEDQLYTASFFFRIKEQELTQISKIFKEKTALFYTFLYENKTFTEDVLRRKIAYYQSWRYRYLIFNYRRFWTGFSPKKTSY